MTKYNLSDFNTMKLFAAATLLKLERVVILAGLQEKLTTLGDGRKIFHNGKVWIKMTRTEVGNEIIPWLSYHCVRDNLQHLVKLSFLKRIRITSKKNRGNMYFVNEKLIEETIDFYLENKEYFDDDVA